MERIIAVLFVLSAAGVGAQQPDPLALADSLLSAGDLARAEQVYSTVLGTNPDARTARLGRATARSWMGSYGLALEDYATVLAAAPDDPSALVGAGYSHLWAGRFDEGRRHFLALLERDPSSFEAEKGLAYAELWRGRPEEAARRFEQLTAQYPQQSDAYAGLAEALLAAGHPEGARAAARNAVALRPDRTDLRGIDRAARRARSPFEVSLTGGYTAFENVRSVAAPSSFGIRSVDVAFRPTRDLTLNAQYDNGISVDTRALAIGGETVPTYRMAGTAAWGGRLITRVGGGIRSLPGDQRQSLAELDQVIVLGALGLSAGWTGLFPSAGLREHVGRLGATLVPTQAWEIGLTGYLRAVDGTDGLTGVLTLTHKLDAPVDITGGVALGRAAATGLDQREIFGHVTARLWAGNGVSLTVRRQSGSGVDSFTGVAAGITLALGPR